MFLLPTQQYKRDYVMVYDLKIMKYITHLVAKRTRTDNVYQHTKIHTKYDESDLPIKHLKK